MTGSQRQFRGNRRSSAGSLPAAVCLILLALLAVAQVAHSHLLESDADHCPLCIVMHTAAPVAIAAIVVVLVPFESSAPVFEAHAIIRPWYPNLFTRPPPAGC